MKNNASAQEETKNSEKTLTPDQSAEHQKEELNLAKNTDNDPKHELEQKRNVLKSIKDFDFQIKKNQEDIEKISEKIDFLTKDLDDLVSLYEIVSEQMNPFVGLSKVTKKRLDALENFTKEVESLKEHVGDIEATIEKNINNFQYYQPPQKPVEISERQKKPSAENTEEKKHKIDDINESDKNSSETQTESSGIENEKNEVVSSTSNVLEQKIEKSEMPLDNPAQTPFSETPQIMSLTSSKIYSEINQEPLTKSYETKEQFTTSFIDEILSSSFNTFFMEQNIDGLIDEYLHTLK